MNNQSCCLRVLLCATTAFGLAAHTAAHAQNSGSGTQTLDLGSVVASGNTNGATTASATGTLAQAHQLKKLAPNIINVQPQSEIQKLPDANLAEALQRVPGITLVTDSGAGRFISIRGLDADLNGTSYDGVHLTAANQSTPTGGGRAVAFDAFPTGMVGGTEVYKTSEPDLDAEGIGGTVNLLPLSLPPGGGPLVQGEIAGGQETLRHTGVYEGNITLGNSFSIPGMRSFANNRPFSLIINYSAHSDRRGIDDVEESYLNNAAAGTAYAPLSTIDLRHYDEHRVTQGYGGELDFDPDPATHLYARVLEGGYDEQLDKNILHFNATDGSGQDANGNPDGTLTDNGNGNFTATGVTAEKDYALSNERINYQLAAVGGRSVIADTVNVDFRGSWEQGLDTTTTSYGPIFTYGTAAGATPFTLLYNTASPAYRPVAAPGVNLNDPTQYYLQGGNSNTPGRTIDSELGVAGNASFADNILGNIGEAKFGGAARFRTEGAESEEFDYNNANTNFTLAQLSGGNQNQVFYNSHYTLTPDAAYQPYFSILGAPTNNIETNISSYDHNSENVYAAYGQETLDISHLEILTGVRVEVTQATYRASTALSGLGGPTAGAIYFPGDDTNYTPHANKQNYTNVFPSLQLKYAFSDAFQVRAAYSTGIARPGFQQISAATSVTRNGANNGEDLVSQGNPSLKPLTENAFDLTAEYYTPDGGIFSINPFYKLFQNYTVATTAEGTYQSRPAQINSYKNIGGAFVRGLEIEARHNFTFLPTPLDGFGAQGNITFVDSHGRYDTDTTGTVFQKASLLPQTSQLTYNAELFYEKGPVEFHFATSYSSRSLYNVSAGGRSFDTFTSPAFRLDVDASLQVTPRWQVFVQGKNLTNTRLQFTQGPSNYYPIQSEFYATDFLVGARFNLGGGHGDDSGSGGSDD